MSVLNRITRQQLLSVLGSLSVLDAYNGRSLLLQDLPPALANAIDRDESKTVDLANMVMACDNWSREAMRILVENTLTLIQGSDAAAQLQTILENLSANQSPAPAGPSAPEARPDPVAPSGPARPPDRDLVPDHVDRPAPAQLTASLLPDHVDRPAPAQLTASLLPILFRPLPRVKERSYRGVVLITIVAVIITQLITYRIYVGGDLGFPYFDLSHDTTYWIYLYPAAVFPALVAAALLGRVSAFLPLAVGAVLGQWLFGSVILETWGSYLVVTALFNSIFVIIGILAALYICYTYMLGIPGETPSPPKSIARPGE